MFGVINSETQAFWQSLANELSRQRPNVGRRVTVIGGRKYRGKLGVVVRHQVDRYEDAFRYGNEASQHYKQMAGRYGFVCMVREIQVDDDDGSLLDTGNVFWVKARYLAVDYPYTDPWEALGDALLAVANI